jgi:hypothetical protein
VVRNWDATKNECSSELNPNADQVNWDNILKGLQVDFCNAKCAESLKPVLVNILKMVDIYDELEELCT